MFGETTLSGASRAYGVLFPWLPAGARRSSSRLAVGLGLSVFLHLAIIAGVRPMAVAYDPPRPLQVEIRQLASSLDALLGITAEPESPVFVAAELRTSAEPRRADPPAPNTAAAPVAGPELPITPENYFHARDLDVTAQPLNEVDLIYPQRAYQMRIRGKVTLQMLINERGGIDQVSVLESEPGGTFEEAALAAAWALRFSPAMKDGRSVKSRKAIEVNFDPYERISTP